MLKHLFRSLARKRDDASNDAGVAAWQRGDLAAGERHFRAAIAADPKSAVAYGNLGVVLWHQQRREEALAALARAVQLDPADVNARVHLANAYAVGNALAPAIEQYREALRRQPGHAAATANLLKPLLDTCDWPAAEAMVAELAARWTHAPDAQVLDSMTPFVSISTRVPQAMRLAIARRYADGVMENAGPRVDAAARDASGRRLRIGYLSADLHEHPTSQLLVGALEHHDRARYEVHAYALDSDDGTAHRARLVAAFEHFHDVRALAHDALARQIAADGIDVLVDLQGYTAESRPQVAALRPAPVQVNYLGYPGTMGAAFVDFILADATLVPPGDEQWYGETVIRLPDTYQANDDRQAIAERAFARSELGLPEDGAVFASFNAHFKIERETFAAWMRILAAVPGSVLWLLGGPGEAALRAAADRSGIEPARIVFATRMRKPEHLARHRAADLFLDTYTYNAHTTASDALWAGLPVLTRPADGFAGRVAASLLRAIGLPELVAPDLDAYERAAVELARNPAALAALRAKLAAHRSSLPLFDTARFTRNLEAAFDEMWARKAR